MCALTHDTKLHSRNIVQAAHESFYSLVPSLSGSGEKIFQCQITGKNNFMELHYHSMPLPFVTADRVRRFHPPLVCLTLVADSPFPPPLGRGRLNKSREFQKNVRGPSSLERQGPQKHNVWFHSITLFLPACEKEKK